MPFKYPLRPPVLFAKLFVTCLAGLMLLSSGNLAGQIENGKYVERHENGKVKVSGHYKNGFKKGNWFYYSAAGLLEKREVWKHGERMITYSYNEKGRLSAITDKNGKTTEREGCNCR